MKNHTKTERKTIGDDAVKAKTGKGWERWFSILDRFGVKEKGHAAAARYLSERHSVGPWWSQMVVVEYEKARGFRTTHQRADDTYEVSVSKTIDASAPKAYEAFTDPAILSKWFTKKASADLRVGGRYSNSDGDHGVFKVLKPPQRIRFTWENPGHSPGTLVEIRLAPKGKAKVSVTVQHMKLKTKRDVKDMKGGWSWALGSLKSFLETGTPIAQQREGPVTKSRRVKRPKSP